MAFNGNTLKLQVRKMSKGLCDQGVLPHSAPSWILSLAENLASSILQDEAAEWHDYIPATTHPPTRGIT